jgi:hypothetical protein
MISPAAASVFFDVIWADDVELALPSLSLVTKMARRMDDPDSLRLRRGSLNERRTLSVHFVSQPKSIMMTCVSNCRADHWQISSSPAAPQAPPLSGQLSIAAS